MNAPSHFERYQLTLTPLSPIHIGSGDSIEPYEYDVELCDGYGILNVYDLDQLLGEMATRQRNEFNRKVNASWHEMRSWLREQFQEKHLKFRRAIEEKAAQELYETINDRDRTGEIELLPRNGISQLAYLPGSSIKGAIRTAVLDAAVLNATDGRKKELHQLAQSVARERNRGRQQRGEQDFQKTAFEYNDAKNDPFRQVAVSDFVQLNRHTGIYRIQLVSTKQESQQAGNILMFREVTKSKILDPNEEIFFQTELRLYPQLTDARWREKSITQKITWQNICDACNEFYGNRLQNELEIHVKTEVYRKRLEEQLDQLKEGECLIRVGRHSHFECVTVSSPYHVRPQKGYGKSRSYVSGKAPFGWARLSVSPLGAAK